MATQEELIQKIEKPTELIDTMTSQAGLGDQPATLPEGTEFKPVMQEIQQDELVQTDVTPVSYTHLTLPTKRIV